MALVIIQEGIKGVVIFASLTIVWVCLSILFGGQVAKKKKKYSPRFTLPSETRKEMATDMFNGLMVKQAAGKYGTNIEYAYQVFYEFLEWKVEWKMKE